MRRGKPKGMTYADVLQQKQLINQALENAAKDEVTQIRADKQTQRALWLSVIAMSDAFGIGGKRLHRYLEALQNATEEYERMKSEVDEEYANEKMRLRAEQISGMDIKYLYESEKGAIG